MTIPDIREQARLCREAGLRIMPIRMPDKVPAVPKGFYGRALPDATAEPDNFEEGEQIGILCGNAGGEARIVGFDRDGDIEWSELEAFLGTTLPATLSSKGDRHRYYVCSIDAPLRQANHLLATSKGHFDTRPDHGGYMREPWEWDGGFDASRIAVLPDAAVEALQRRTPFEGERPEREPSELQISDHDGLIVENLASVWQKGVAGDKAFGGLGGWLYRYGVSWERAEAIAAHLAAEVQTTHPNAVGRVAQAYDGRCPLGWTTLIAALREDGAGVGHAALAVAENNLTALIRQSVDPLPPKAEEAPAPEAPSAEPSYLEQVLDRIANLGGLDSRKLEEPPWICAGLGLARGVRPAALIGYAGVGKTTALSSIALGVASGTKALGFAPCVQGRVLIIDHEDEFGYKRSLRELAAAAKTHVPEIDYLDGTVTLTDDRSLEVFPYLCAEYDLIICDSLLAMNAGLNENANEYVDRFGQLHQWAKHSRPGGTCVLFARHSGKNGRDDEAAGRGSSTIDGWMSTQWLLTRNDSSDWSKGVRWSCKRINGVNLRVPPPDFDSTYDEKAGYKFAALGEKKAGGPMRQKLLDFFKLEFHDSPDRWFTTTEIRARVKGKSQAISDALIDMSNERPRPMRMRASEIGRGYQYQYEPKR